MATSKPKPKPDTRQIVGFSLAPQMAREVKTYAAERGLTLRELFEELWTTHKKHHPEGRK